MTFFYLYVIIALIRAVCGCNFAVEMKENAPPSVGVDGGAMEDF